MHTDYLRAIASEVQHRLRCCFQLVARTEAGNCAKLAEGQLQTLSGAGSFGLRAAQPHDLRPVQEASSGFFEQQSRLDLGPLHDLQRLCTANNRDWRELRQSLSGWRGAALPRLQLQSSLPFQQQWTSPHSRGFSFAVGAEVLPRSEEADESDGSEAASAASHAAALEHRLGTLHDSSAASCREEAAEGEDWPARDVTKSSVPQAAGIGADSFSSSCSGNGRDSGGKTSTAHEETTETLIMSRMREMAAALDLAMSQSHALGPTPGGDAASDRAMDLAMDVLNRSLASGGTLGDSRAKMTAVLDQAIDNLSRSQARKATAALDLALDALSQTDALTTNRARTMAGALDCAIDALRQSLAESGPQGDLEDQTAAALKWAINYLSVGKAHVAQAALSRAIGILSANRSRAATARLNRIVEAMTQGGSGVKTNAALDWAIAALSKSLGVGIKERSLTHKLKFCQSWQLAADLISQHHHRFDFIHCGAALTTLARIYRRLPSREREAMRASGAVFQLQGAVGACLGACNAQGLANMLYSLAAMDYQLRPEFLQQASDRILELLPKFNNLDLHHTLWALGRMRQDPPREVLRGLLVAAQPRLKNMDSWHVANMVWALGRLQPQASKGAPFLPGQQAHVPIGFMKAACGAVRRRMRETNVSALCSFTTGLAHLRYWPGQGVMDAVAINALANVRKLGGQELSSLSWAIARLHASLMPPKLALSPLLPLSGPVSAYFRRVCSIVTSNPMGLVPLKQSAYCPPAKGWNPQQVCMLVWALAVVGEQKPVPRETVKVLIAAAQPLLPSFTAQGISVLAWGLARLDATPPEDFLDALVAEADCRVDSFTAQALTSTLWGLVKLGQQPSDNLLVNAQLMVQSGETMQGEQLTIFDYEVMTNVSEEYAKLV